VVRYIGTYGGLSEKERERHEQLAEVRHFTITRMVLLEDLVRAKKRGNASKVVEIEASLKRLQDSVRSSVVRPKYVPKPIEETKLAEKHSEEEPTEELHDEFVIDDVIRELRIQTKQLKIIVRTVKEVTVLLSSKMERERHTRSEAKGKVP
jgi:hypothetical protein